MADDTIIRLSRLCDDPMRRWAGLTICHSLDVWYFLPAFLCAPLCPLWWIKRLFEAGVDLPPLGSFVGRNGLARWLIGMDAQAFQQNVGERLLALLLGIARGFVL